MKRTLLFSAVLSLAIGAASAADVPQALWGNCFDGTPTAGDQCQKNVLGADGNIYWHLLGGSKNGQRDITYAGQVLFQGSDYDPNGTSQNNNLCILKTNQQGEVVWKMYSTSCDYYTNEGSVAATSDGGVVFTAKMRSTDDGGSGELLFADVTLIDGKGVTHNYAWPHNEGDRRFYRMMVGRLSAEGELMWVKFITPDRTPGPAASGNNADLWTNTINTSALAVAADEENNVYFGGNFRNRMIIDGTDVVLTPHNISKWSGDPQAAAGDLFLIKLKGDGTYLGHLTTTVSSGTPTSESLAEIIWADGALYAHALFFSPDCSFTLGGKNFTTAGTFSPVLMRIDANLNATWITPLKGETIQGKYGFQNCGITKVNNSLWFTGQYDGVITYDADHSFSSNPAYPSVREGFLSKFDATSGAMLAGVSSADSYPRSLGANYASLCGYFKAIQNPTDDSKVYVYGYGMNANLGIFLRGYDAQTLKSNPQTDEWSLVKGGQMPTCQSIAYDADNAKIFVSARGRMTPFVLYGNPSLTVQQPNSTWTVLLAGYQMPDSFLQTGLVRTTFAEELEVKGSKGMITVRNGMDDATTVVVYDITGRQAARIDAVPGSTSVSLPSGVYIVAGKKVMI